MCESFFILAAVNSVDNLFGRTGILEKKLYLKLLICQINRKKDKHLCGRSL
ncbi:unnamed protein product [Prunus brigantina]